MSSYYTKPPSFARRKNITEQQANEYDALAERIEREEGTRPGLLRALISQESGYDPQATSNKGAKGLGQLMPATAKRFGVTDITDPEQNLRGAARYLKFLDERFQGDLDKIYAGYNAGEGAVDKYGGIPPYKETQAYVPRVRGNFARITGEQYNAPATTRNAGYRPSKANSANSGIAPEDDPFQLLASAGFAQPEQSNSAIADEDDPFKLLENAGLGIAKPQPQPQPTPQAKTSSPSALYGKPGQPRVDQGVRIFNPSETRSDVLAKQFGFSKPEIERFKKDFGREPFEGYKDVVGLADQVRASDPGRFAQLSNFLKNVRAGEQANTSGIADPNSVYETLVTAKSPENQRAIGATLGSGANAALFGNLNKLQKPLTGVDIPEPERVRTKVVQGVDGKPIEVYDEEANPTGSLAREVLSPENLAGFGANLLAFRQLGGLIGRTGGAIATRAAQGSRLARAGQVFAGTAENVGRLENAGKTAALFGSAALLTDPDPQNQLTPAQQVAKRIEAGIASGATGWAAGVLGGINPSIAKEVVTFTVPFAVKTALEGYLAGLSYEEIEKAVSLEAFTNATLPIGLRGGEILSSGRQGVIKAANKLGVGEKFARDVRVQARETLGELQDIEATATGALAEPNIAMEAGAAPPPSSPNNLTPEQRAAQVVDLMAERANILGKGLEKVTPEQADRLQQIELELRALKQPAQPKPTPATVTEPPIAKRPSETVAPYELTSDEIITEIDSLQQRLRQLPNTSLEAIEARKRVKALEVEQRQRLAGDEQIKESDIDKAIELDRRISETNKLLQDEMANGELLTDPTELDTSNERLRVLAEQQAELELERSKLGKIDIPAKPVKPTEVAPAKTEQLIDLKAEPKRVIFDDAGNTRSYAEVEREKLQALEKELKLKSEQTKKILELQRQFTTDPITGFEISEYIQPSLEAAMLNDRPSSYAKLEVVNLGGANAGFGNPLASNDVIGKFGDILKAELEPLNLFGKVNLFRGKGGQIEVIASNVDPELLQKVLTRAQTRINKEIVVPGGLDKIASPKLKSAKANKDADPQEYIKNLGKSGGGVQFVVEGVNNRASAKEIRETAAKRLEDSYIERAKNVREDQLVPEIRPVRPTRDAEPSFLTRESQPVEVGDRFLSPQELLAKEIRRLSKGLTPAQNKVLEETVSKLLLKDTLLGKYGFLGASEREYTARRAAEYTDATSEPSFYAEFDFRNVGGLNKFLGEKPADDVLEQFGKAISENLQKLGNKTTSVSLFRHGGDEVSAIIVGADRSRIQTAIDKAVIDVDKYVKATNIDGYDLSTLPHPKNSLPGTGIIGAIAQFEPLNKNAPLTMQERVEQVLGKAGSEIEDIKEALKEQSQAAKLKETSEAKEGVKDGQRGEIGKTGASTPSGRSASTKSSTKTNNRQPGSTGESSRGSTSEGSRSTTPGDVTQNNEGSTVESRGERGSETEPASTEPAATVDAASQPTKPTEPTSTATDNTKLAESTTAPTAEVEKPPRKEKAAWLQEAEADLPRLADIAERTGLADEIEELSAKRLVSKQIINALGDKMLDAVGRSDDAILNSQGQSDLLEAVRRKRGIPSQRDAKEFEAWIAKRNQNKPPKDDDDDDGGTTPPPNTPDAPPNTPASSASETTKAEPQPNIEALAKMNGISPERVKQITENIRAKREAEAKPEVVDQAKPLQTEPVKEAEKGDLGAEKKAEVIDPIKAAKLRVDEAKEQLKAVEKLSYDGLNDIERRSLTSKRAELVALVEKRQEDVRKLKASEAAKSSTGKLIDTIKVKLANNEKIANDGELFKLANAAFQGKVKINYTSQDAYNALEGAVNSYILDKLPELSKLSNSEILTKLQEITSLLPTTRNRSGEKVDLQQFSTPPGLAFVAAKATGATAKDLVLEPSAGTGGLAIFAKALGADVLANDLDAKRADVMKAIGFDKVVAGLKAEHIDALLGEQLQKLGLDPDLRPDVVLMNPPFSKNEGARDLDAAGKHIKSALLRLKPGGRLVAIVGEGMATNAPRYKNFFDATTKDYNLRANIGLSGKEYEKYGTTFGNRLLVFDKNGSTDFSKIIEKNNLTHAEALDLIGDLANDRSNRSSTSEPVLDTNTRDISTSAEQPTVRTTSKPVVPVSRRRGNVKKPGMVADGVVQVESRPTIGTDTDVPDLQRPDQVEPIGESEPARSSTDYDSDNIQQKLKETKEQAEKVSPTAQAEGDGQEDVGTFVAYKPPFASVSPHPGNMVETASMAGVAAPPIDPRDMNFHPRILSAWTTGALSDMQMEGVSRAKVRHNTILPNGRVGGYLTGDGTGSGKGRTNAAVLMDNWLEGRRRQIWVSVNEKVFSQARADLDAIGASDIPMIFHGDAKLGDILNKKFTDGDGIIFTTYHTLGGKPQAGTGKTRLDQILEWVREKDGEAVIVVDEAHSAKNLLQEARAVKGKEGADITIDNATNSAKAIYDLDEALPKARFMYSTATSASQVKHLAVMSRLGLWGPGTAFPAGRTDFINKISSGGLAMMEMLAQEMKARGLYNARQLSYAGTSFSEVTHELTPKQIEAYKLTSEAWRKIQDKAKEALGYTGADKNAQIQAQKDLRAAQQRFYGQILTAMKTPTVIKEVKQALAENKSVIISMITTGDSHANREKQRILKEGGTLDDLDYTPRQTILSYLENAFPRFEYTERTVIENGKPKTIKELLKDADGKPVESQEAKRIRQDTIALVEKLMSGDFSLPTHPIDAILNEFGHDNVAELSGRAKQHVIDRTTYAISERNRPPAEAEKTAFQLGKKKIAIITAAADTGISLHASLDNPPEGQLKRVHIIQQLSWSADRTLQGMGRSHRTNQASAPEYKSVVTNAGGERRFSSTVAKRLADMGALTKGERAATGADELTKYNFDTDEGKKAAMETFEILLSDIKGSRQRFVSDTLAQALENNELSAYDVLDMMGSVDNDPDSKTFRELKGGAKEGDLNHLLNRILNLPVDIQNGVFDTFMDRFGKAIAKAKEDGTFDIGAQDFVADSVKFVDQQELFKDPKTGATANLHVFEAVRNTTPTPVDQVSKLLKEMDATKDEGIYKDKKGNLILAKEINAVTKADGSIIRKFAIAKPNNISPKPITYDTLKTFEKISASDIEQSLKLWEEQYNTLPRQEISKHYATSGAQLSIYDKLLESLQGKKAETTRVKDTVTGKRIVGTLLPARAIPKLLSMLNLGKGEKVDTSSTAVFSRVLNNGIAVDLQNGLMLKKTKVYGNEVIEIKGEGNTDVPNNIIPLLKSYGLDPDISGSKKRFYISGLQEQAIPVLDQLFESHPVKLKASDIVDADPEASDDITVVPTKLAPIQTAKITKEQPVIPKTPDERAETVMPYEYFKQTKSLEGQALLDRAFENGNAALSEKYVTNGYLIISRNNIPEAEFNSFKTKQFIQEDRYGTKATKKPWVADALLEPIIEANKNNGENAQLLGFRAKNKYDKYAYFTFKNKAGELEQSIIPGDQAYYFISRGANNFRYNTKDKTIGFYKGEDLIGLCKEMSGSNEIIDINKALETLDKNFKAKPLGTLESPNKKLYQEQVSPDKLVAPGGVSRQKLWNVIATHGLVDADGKKLNFKQAIEVTDKVMYLMDTFARSTGKDVDTWYKETFANAVSEKMLKANGKVNVKAATEFLKNGQTVLRLFEGADASTLVHESFHIFRQQLTPQENATLGNWLKASGLGEVKEGKFSTAQEEYIARAGENYLRSGKLPEQAPSMLKQVFNSFGGWLKSIYDRLQSNGKIKIPFGKGIKKFFDEVQFDEQARGVFEQRFITGTNKYQTTPLGSDTFSPNQNRDLRRVTTPTETKGSESDPRYNMQTPMSKPGFTGNLPDSSDRSNGNAPNYSLAGSGEIKTRSVPESARPFLDPGLAKDVPEQQYNTLTNDETAKAARSFIERKPEEALLLATGSKSGAFENEIAIQMLSKSQADGDFTQARQILDALAQRSTEAGRAIQILSRIANASPEATLMFAKRQIERNSPEVSAGIRKQADIITERLSELVNALEATAPVKEAIVRFFQKAILPSKLKDKVIDAVAKQPTRQGQLQAINDVVKKHYGIATLTDATAQKIYDLSKEAQQLTGYEQEQAHARIARLIGEEIPATTGKKLNFWLRVADLFNPSGALFNTTADLAYSSPLGLETGVDILASAIDKTGKALGVFKERSLAAPNVGEQLTDFKTNLGRVRREIAEGIDTQEVLEKRMGVPSSVPVKGKIPALLDKGVRFGYGWTQSASFRTAKAESIRNQMKVAKMNGQKLDTPTTQMIERAELEAAQRAMIDDNFVSKALSGIRKSLNKLSTGGKSEEFGLGSIVLTYTQVPGSLLKRGIEFSPAGFGKVAYQIFKAAKNGDFDQRKFVRDLSRAIIGTGLGLGVAALLHRVGVLQQPSEGDDEGRLRRLQGDEGLNTYRLNVDGFLRYAASGFGDTNAAKAKPGDRLINYEFMQPLGFIMNFGANMDATAAKAREAAKQGKPINTTWEAIKGLTSAGIQTLNDAPLIRSLNEAGQITEGEPGEYGKNLAKKLATRPVPALVRQARNYLDNTKRITDEPGDTGQSIKNAVTDALPGYSKSLPAQKTAFGEDKERIVGGGGFVDSFVLGGKVNKYQSTEETATAKRIFDEREPQQGRDYHIPSSPRELKVNGKPYTLTAEDKSNYQNYVGKQAKQIYQFASKSNVFNKLNAEQQGTVLAKYLDIVKEKAKVEVLGDKPPTKEKILKRQVLPSKEVFDHNLTVLAKTDELLSQVETKPEWAKLYSQLDPEQQEKAKRQITSLFNQIKIDEYSDKPEIVQKAEANKAKLLLPILKPELQVPIILQMAKFYKKEFTK